MKQKQIHISDHALIRYMERVRGFDFDAERAAIRQTCGNIVNARVRSAGHIFIVEEGVLVSVVPVGDGPSKITRDRVMGRTAR